ncbi:hypothetical protein K501DRAFT_239045 [Backusella circina FSU 941]|nr:hypothetical protein K501DRAFT_239045 [Backusella circina FSU 941]
MSNEEEITTTDKNGTLPKLGLTSPILSYFCIYNPTLSNSEENTKDQILYFTAKEEMPLDSKMKQVGLAQALINFTNTFSPSHPAQNVHSQKHRMVFLEAEPNFWMVMSVELGILRRQTKDGKLITEHLDAQLNDRALESVLKLGHDQFKLLHGSFSDFLHDSKSSRQQMKSLVMAMEDFYSEWIWKWDFDRLDKMCFSAIFNGISHQPLADSNHQMMRALDKEIMKKAGFDDDGHLFVFHIDKPDAIIYRSSSLSIMNVCSLKKFIIQVVQKHIKYEHLKKELEKESAAALNPKVSSLKSFTKSLSTSNLIGYFSYKSLEPPISPQSSHAILNSTCIHPLDTDSNSDDDIEQRGIYLTGLIDSTAINMNGEQQPIKKTDIVKVYLKGSEEEQSLVSYYLLIYKHNSGLIFNYLLPHSLTVEKRLSNITFYNDLEKWMIDNELDTLTQNITNDINSDREEETDIDLRYYKYFSFDSKTLEIKSTLMDHQTNGDKNKKKKKKKDKDGTSDIVVNNDILLQILELKNDFDIGRNSEVYTRSTLNCWIAGHRHYHSKEEYYKEAFLIANKKDTSLANVQENLCKLSAL